MWMWITAFGRMLKTLFLEMWRKGKFQPQNMPMYIPEKNETKAKHTITFRASNSVNG